MGWTGVDRDRAFSNVGRRAPVRSQSSVAFELPGIECQDLRGPLVASQASGFTASTRRTPSRSAGARRFFHLNYLDATIKSANAGSWIRYASRRTHVDAPAAELNLEYRPIGESYLSQPGTLAHWLTARFCLYVTDSSGNTLRGEIDHRPWELCDAQADCSCELHAEWNRLAIAGSRSTTPLCP